MGLNQKINSDIYQKINSDIYQNILFLYLTIVTFFSKVSSFQNMQQYIISHQPWPMELAELTNLGKNKKSDLTTPLILIQHLQPIHIVNTSLTKTLTSLVKLH